MVLAEIPKVNRTVEQKVEELFDELRDHTESDRFQLAEFLLNCPRTYLSCLFTDRIKARPENFKSLLNALNQMCKRAFPRRFEHGT